MNPEMKKAHHSAATLERAVGNGQANTFSNNHSTAIGSDSQQVPNGLVSSVLLRGEANAVPGKTLVTILGLKDLRELTRLIERERRVGIPVCATTNCENPGYYLPDSTVELERYVKSLDRRLKNVRETREAVQDTLNRMTDQLEIEE